MTFPFIPIDSEVETTRWRRQPPPPANPATARPLLILRHGGAAPSCRSGDGTAVFSGRSGDDTRRESGSGDGSLFSIPERSGSGFPGDGGGAAPSCGSGDDKAPSSYAVGTAPSAVARVAVFSGSGDDTRGESGSGDGSLFSVLEQRGSGFPGGGGSATGVGGASGDIGLGGPIDGLSGLVDGLAEFFCFLFY